MKKYSDILDILLRSIEKRDGRKPQEIADKYKAATREAMSREGICQIIADESESTRYMMLLRFPSLIVPYIFRIRSTGQKGTSIDCENHQAPD